MNLKSLVQLDTTPGLKSYYEQNKQQFLRLSLQILTEYSCV